jgi:Xaa-Pro aminopeptidase
VIEASGKTTLFCRPKDLEREIWDGIRLGPKAAPAAAGRGRRLQHRSAGRKNAGSCWPTRSAVWFPFATHEGLGTQVDSWLDKVRTRVRLGDEPPPSQHDLCKCSTRCASSRTATRSPSCGAPEKFQPARTCAPCRPRPPCCAPVKGGLREYHLEAELLHEFRRHGSQFPAYTSIVAAGANACVLHYRAGDTELKAGELCLIDAGCELDGYASDITRTFPGGRQVHAGAAQAV